MKTIIAATVVAAAATLVALPAAANQVASGSDAAVAHFNQSLMGGDVIVLQDGSDDTTRVSSKSGNIGTAFDIFNASADTQDGITGQNGATLAPKGAVNGEAAAIFERLRRESLENEG